jgi:hypothetical protein
MYDLILKGREKDKSALKANTLCPMQQFVESKFQVAQQYMHAITSTLTLL